MNTRQKSKIRVEFTPKPNGLWDYVVWDASGKALYAGSAYGTKLEIRREAQFLVDRQAAKDAAKAVTP